MKLLLKLLDRSLTLLTIASVGVIGIGGVILLFPEWVGKLIPDVQIVSQQQELIELPVVLYQARELNQIVVREYPLSQVIPIQQPITVLGVDVISSQLSYSAYGTVTVAVDLAQLTDSDVSWSANEPESELQITLPPPIVSIRLEESSQVTNYSQGVLNWGPDLMPLREAAEHQAFQSFGQTACLLLVKQKPEIQQAVADRLMQLQALSSNEFVQLTVHFLDQPSISCARRYRYGK